MFFLKFIRIRKLNLVTTEGLCTVLYDLTNKIEKVQMKATKYMCRGKDFVMI